jgi:broad specificity phosphatase PhoE
MYLYLTRHGETIWNAEGKTQGTMDIPLSDKGIRQAEILADRLVYENISSIYCSSLDRAYRTAAIIGEKTGHVPEKTDALREIAFGAWEGLTLQQIEDRFPGQLDNRSKDCLFCPEGGESILSVQGRVRSFLDILSSSVSYDKNSRILIVAHAYTIRLIIMELIGLPLRHLWDFRLDNTGISIIQSHQGKSRIICLNDTCHMRKL